MPVKGPRVYRMVVRQDRPLRRVMLWLLAGLVAALALALAWQAGRHDVLAALGGQGGAANLEERLSQLGDENRALRDELAVFRVGGDVAREVEEQVRAENRALQDRIAELEEAVGYYRRVVMPDRSGKGLRVERLELVPASAAQVWTLQLVLVRTGELDAHVEGRLDGVLLARHSQGTRRIPLGSLLGADRQAFRVRYVEDMKVEFRLPAGESPERLDLVVDVTAPRPARIERSWSRQSPAN